MRRSHQKNLAIATASTLWLSNFFVAARAFQCGRAAERDESNGFPYTAAMEWRKAAELVPPHTRAAEYFWRQWERIMHLPRRLAGPCELTPADTAAERSRSANEAKIDLPFLDQISLPMEA